MHAFNELGWGQVVSSKNLGEMGNKLLGIVVMCLFLHKSLLSLLWKSSSKEDLFWL